MFGNLTEVIFRESDQFSQFIQTLYTSQMVNMLREGGIYTVFAPNNYAFSRIPKTLLDKILQDPETAAGKGICFLTLKRRTKIAEDDTLIFYFYLAGPRSATGRAPDS